MNCRICSAKAELFFKNSRTYYKCLECDLIFTNELLDKKSEEKYFTSKWGNADPKFWESQVNAILDIVRNYHEPRHILDFGAGGGEITEELKKRTFNVTPIDPLTDGYLKDQDFKNKFDTVIAIEVIEHLPNLWEEIIEIEKVLSEDGLVFFSTFLTNTFIDSKDAVSQFENWWYKDDPTHVNFFCNKALLKMAESAGFYLDIYQDKAFVLFRPNQIT